LGSTLAGIKAGTLAGAAYMGGLAIANVAVLYAFKADTLSSLSQLASCASAASTNSTAAETAEQCLNSVVSVTIPIEGLLAFFVSLIYAGVFGRFYERFPGKSPSARGVTVGVIAGFSLLVLGPTIVYFGLAEMVAITTFFIAWTFVYGLLIGRLYKRYTREVQFANRDGKALRVLVDGRDCTGKTLTFATRSSHAVKAKVREGKSFRGWSVSGGVTVEDPRSLETTMNVEGDGVLKAQSSSAR
jgi:hypothetical protein